MEKVSLSVQLVNAVMQYLGTKPFQEVFQIIEAVQKEVNAQQEQVQQVAPKAE